MHLNDYNTRQYTINILNTRNREYLSSINELCSFSSISKMQYLKGILCQNKALQNENVSHLPWEIHASCH